MRKIIIILHLWVAAIAYTDAYASGESDRPITSASAPRLEFSAPNFLLGSLFATLNLGWGDHFSLGPSVGFHPLYLFTPRDTAFSYDLGIDCNLFVMGDRHSSSWFINPYAYYSGFLAYRVEESIPHLGFNLGYRWLFQNGYSIAVGAGIQTTYSFMSVYSYSPRGRVPLGEVQNWIPIAPSFKLTVGLPL